jgi:hypothetical protein
MQLAPKGCACTHVTSIAFSPAAERNKQALLEALRQLLPQRCKVLEIASGTGQHAVWFAAAMPGWTWQPSDFDAGALPAIDALREQAGLVNVLPALQQDVLDSVWSDPDSKPGRASGQVSSRTSGRSFDAIFCANMIHIAPWPAGIALLRGAARRLAGDGMLITYGPYLEDEVVTSPGNLAFDESLRMRNPLWGIRRREDLEHEASRAGLSLKSRRAMPSNNLLLAFGR